MYPEENLHLTQNFYTTSGGDGCDKYEVWTSPPFPWNETCFIFFGTFPLQTDRLTGQTDRPKRPFFLEIYSVWKDFPDFWIFYVTRKTCRGSVNLLKLTLCKSLPRITYFSSFCKPLLKLKWNSPPNKLGFVKCQLSNHRRLRSIQVLIVSRSCQTHNDDSVSINQTFHSVRDKSIFADDDTKCVLFTALIFCLLYFAAGSPVVQ